jgi:hypothetical protein
MTQLAIGDMVAMESARVGFPRVLEPTQPAELALQTSEVERHPG